MGGGTIAPGAGTPGAGGTVAGGTVAGGTDMAPAVAAAPGEAEGCAAEAPLEDTDVDAEPPDAAAVFFADLVICGRRLCAAASRLRCI